MELRKIITRFYVDKDGFIEIPKDNKGFSLTQRSPEFFRLISKRMRFMLNRYEVSHHVDRIELNLYLGNTVTSPADIKIVRASLDKFVEYVIYDTGDIEARFKNGSVPKAGEVYVHYKGAEYTVIRTAIEATNGSSDGRLKVIYRDSSNEVWIRDLEEFNSIVPIGDIYHARRFTLKED